VVNVLLRELEAFNGVVIFATNLAANFDPAFERRIRTHVLFEMPGVEERERIWQVQIHPRKTPLADRRGLRALAERYAASGGDIKNAVLKAAAAAAAEPGPDVGKRIHQRHFEQAMEDVLAAKSVMRQSLPRRTRDWTRGHRRSRRSRRSPRRDGGTRRRGTRSSRRRGWRGRAAWRSGTERRTCRHRKAGGRVERRPARGPGVPPRAGGYRLRYTRSSPDVRRSSARLVGLEGEHVAARHHAAHRAVGVEHREVANAAIGEQGPALDRPWCRGSPSARAPSSPRARGWSPDRAARRPRDGGCRAR
jgi:hypothetical protein